MRGAVRPAAGQPTYTTGTVSWLTEDPEAPRSQPAAPNPIQPVVLQRPMDNRGAIAGGDEIQDYHIRLTPPGPDTLFRRDSETQLFERMRQEALSQTRPERIEFPKEQYPQLEKAVFQPRAFPPATKVVEPNYTCYHRLNYEQLNMERYGWDLGFITPFVSTAIFFKDVLLLPYHIGTEPCRRYECNTGYCLPGTPVPLLLYPPQFSLTGLFLEATTVTGLILVFPG